MKVQNDETFDCPLQLDFLEGNDSSPGIRLNVESKIEAKS
tara:strand:+ start:407 stop:526 length:120 start_codon:yes stop_codon:yes gene_type:complete